MGIRDNKWFSLIRLLAPIILSVAKPQLAPLAPAITDAIIEAESIKGASGGEKLVHVQNIATATADAMNSITGKTVVNPDELHDAVAHGASTVVSVINLLHKSSQ